MRIGVFSDAISIPPKEGISLHVYELLRSISDDSSHEVVLFMCDRGMLDHKILESEPYTIVLIPEHDFFEISYIEMLIKRYNIQLAQTHKTYIAATVLGEACRRAEVPMVYEMHDLEKDVVPLYFTGNEVVSETKKHDEFQRQACAYASLVRVMSRYDYDYIATNWHEFDNKLFIWLPVATEATDADFCQDPDRQMLSYIGNMSYLPNAEGAQAIVDKLASRMKNNQFCFVGRGSERYGSQDIDARGMVDDLTPILRSTAIGLAPIFSGSGMKIKNLTYLKHGIPVLTTSLGAQGYPVSPAMIIEDNLERWPTIIDSLLTDRKLLASLSLEAKHLFLDNFESNHVNRQLYILYDRCLTDYGVRKRQLKKLVAQRDINPVEMYWIREYRETLSDLIDDTVVIPSSCQHLVILEGLPGSGKSSLLRALESQLKVATVPEMVATVDMELPTPFLDHDLKKYAIARRPGITVMDRGVDSTLAVELADPESKTCSLTIEAVRRAYANGHLTKPDVVIYLRVPVDVSLARQNAWNAPLWRNRVLLESVEKYYQTRLVGQSNVIEIDATQDRGAVIKQAIEQLEERGLI